MKIPTRTSVVLLGLIPGLGRSPGEGKGYPLQYFGLENSTDSAVHEVAKSWTQLSSFHFTSQWIKICLPTQGTCVLSLVQEDPTYPRSTKPMSHYYQVHALDPRGYNYRAHMPQLLSPRAATTEAHVPRTCAPQEKPPK